MTSPINMSWAMSSKGQDINISQFLAQSPLEAPTTSTDVGQQVVQAAQVLGDELESPE